MPRFWPSILIMLGSGWVQHGHSGSGLWRRLQDSASKVAEVVLTRARSDSALSDPARSQALISQPNRRRRTTWSSALLCSVYARMPSEWPLVSAKAGTASGGAPAPNTFSNSGERIGESAGQTSGLATSASMNETGGACVALGRSSKLELRLWLSFFHGRWLRQQQSGAHRVPPYPYCDYQYPYRDYRYPYRVGSTLNHELLRAKGRQRGGGGSSSGSNDPPTFLAEDAAAMAAVMAPGKDRERSPTVCRECRSRPSREQSLQPI